MRSPPQHVGQPFPGAGHHGISRLAKQSLRDLLYRFLQLQSDLASRPADAVETTHELQVTSRRADVALRIFKEWLPHDRRRSMQRLLQVIRIEAGAVRDLDLLEQRWNRPDDPAAPAVPQEGGAWLQSRIRTLHTEARSRLYRRLSRRAVIRFRRRSEALVRRVRRRNDHSARSLIRRAMAKLAGRLIDAFPSTANSLQESHQTRIHARRLRYAFELLKPVLPVESFRACPLLVQLQEQLGQINDDVTALRCLQESMEACGDPKIIPALRSLVAQAETAARDRLAKWNGENSDQIEQLRQQLQQTFIDAPHGECH